MNRSNSRSLSKLKRLGFDGAYLALLTLEGLKPLSRLENCSKAAFRRVLENVGLRTRVVRRWTRSGKLVAETIFGRSADTLAEYTAWFDNKPLRHNADDVRIEGRLFGYPTCCIESYVSHGYAANSISPADQRILFHWACPRCEVTPGLLPQYRQVYLECRRLFTPNGSLIGKPANAKSRYSRTTLAAIAASIAAVLGFPQSSIATSKMLQFDPHCLPLESGTDPDRDLIASEEEVILRFDPSNPDQNQNAIPDGADLARELADRIASLPDAPSTTGPYVIHHPAFGLEICKVCAETANMGFVTIVNPLENQAIDIPHIGLHYLAHGSFQFGGTVHEGRLNPPLLKMVVTSTGLGHFIPDPEAYDADADGLRDWEEPFFGTNPSTRDSNSNGVIDGAEVMRALKANLDALPRAPNLADGPKDTPFIVEHPMKGVETCPQCGERVGMNIWDVINPITNATMSIPSMALHYMLHCGPSWEGGVLMGG
ncbi:MAG: DUF483 domain-containing protein, partial [Verrucomicrobiae bacterium]|nr:DUF483 domain-containing protein [Verrucomicrobiae bacterium]